MIPIQNLDSDVIPVAKTSFWYDSSTAISKRFLVHVKTSFMITNSELKFQNDSWFKFPIPISWFFERCETIFFQKKIPTFFLNLSHFEKKMYTKFFEKTLGLNFETECILTLSPYIFRIFCVKPKQWFFRWNRMHRSVDSNFWRSFWGKLTFQWHFPGTKNTFRTSFGNYYHAVDCLNLAYSVLFDRISSKGRNFVGRSWSSLFIDAVC